MAIMGVRKEKQEKDKRRKPKFYELSIDFMYIILYDLHISLCGIISFYR